MDILRKKQLEKIKSKDFTKKNYIFLLKSWSYIMINQNQNLFFFYKILSSPTNGWWAFSPFERCRADGTWNIRFWYLVTFRSTRTALTHRHEFFRRQNGSRFVVWRSIQMQCIQIDAKFKVQRILFERKNDNAINFLIWFCALKFAASLNAWMRTQNIILFPWKWVILNSISLCVCVSSFSAVKFDYDNWITMK